MITCLLFRRVIVMDYQHDRHSVHLIVYHLIWCPKRRRRVLVGPVQKRLKQIIAEVITENSWQLIELAIQPDHVHLFVRKLPTLWTHSYFLSTAGNVSSETIQRYIERQSHA